MFRKIKSVRTKMLLLLLPGIILGLVLITVIAGYTSYQNITELTQQKMYATIAANGAEIRGDLSSIKLVCLNVESTINAIYEDNNAEGMINVLLDLVHDNPMINGGGIWFEENFFPGEQWTCPFAYRDGSNMVVSYSYVEDSGEYTSTDWYTNAINGKYKEAYITAPYYDASAGIVMVTYSSPLTDGNGKNIGAVTLDISLATIVDMINNLDVGGSGYGILTSEDGIYIAGVEQNKLTTTTYATKEANASLAAAMEQVIGGAKGSTTFINDAGAEETVYYNTLEGLNWHLAILVPSSELYASVSQMIRRLVIVALVLIVLVGIIVIAIIQSIVKGLVADEKFAHALANADYTVPNLRVTTADEIGKLGNALNTMYDSTKDIVKGISDQSANMSQASDTLGSSAQSLADEFGAIKSNMTAINEAMMSASAATEEVNASTEEVNASIRILSREAEQSQQQAEEIQVRASEIRERTVKASDSASELADSFSVQLEDSIRKSDKVEEIGALATAISEIADQINLLSLNASIEAARAGESGKGFAVVATEIGKLANDTAGTVEQIQGTITTVQDAVQGLSHDAGEILKFINETVKPQYTEFIDVAEQYGNDAQQFHESSSKISEMSGRVSDTMGQVTIAIQQIAESAQDTADLSAQVTSSVSSVTDSVNDVSAMSEEQAATASELNSSVSRFKL